MKYLTRLRAARHGFSLIEMSIVLAVVSIVVAGVLPFVLEGAKDGQKTTTLERFQELDAALFGYYQENGDLPCPASVSEEISSSTFGVAVADCTTAVAGSHFSDGAVTMGSVPTRTLGLPDHFALDGWGNRIAYHVSLNSVGSGDLVDGSIRIVDHAGAERSNDAVYAFVSAGMSGHGAYTIAGVRRNAGSTNTSELENCDCTSVAADGTFNNTIAYGIQTGTPGGTDGFDDVVHFMFRETIEQRDRPDLRADLISGFSQTFVEFGDNIALGSNYLSGDGDDEGLLVDADGNVTITGNLTVQGTTFAENGLLPGFPTTCTALDEGLIRYNATETQVEFCDGSTWAPVGQSFQWSVGAWSSCSTTCGTGTQTRTVTCTNNGGVVVANSFCAGSPPSTSQSCFTTAGCTYSWQYSGWSSCSGGYWYWGGWSGYGSCSASCGGGSMCQNRSCFAVSGSKSRSATCMRSDGVPVSSMYCSSTPWTSQSCTPGGWCSGSSSNCTSCNTHACMGTNGGGSCSPYTTGPCAGGCGHHMGSHGSWCRSKWSFWGTGTFGGCTGGSSMVGFTGTSFSCFGPI